MTLIRDLRLAIRSQARSPGLTAATTLTLGLAFGVGAAVFGVLHSVVFSPLPFEDADRLVIVRHFDSESGSGDFSSSFPQFLDYRGEAESFSGMAGWRTLRPTLTSDDGVAPERIAIVAATHNLLPLLGIEPVLGRAFTAEDDRVGAAPTAILSYAHWSARFGADPGVIGRTVRIDGIAHTVVGVLSEAFRVERTGTRMVPSGETQVWLPYRASLGAEGMDVRGLMNVEVVARLAPTVTVELASREMNLIAGRFASQYREFENLGVRVVGAQQAVTEPVRPAMALLFGSGIVVFLIACTNVLTLILGRASDRGAEIAVRTALGAGRGRLVQLFVAEAVALVIVGAAVGALMAAWSLAGLRVLDPGGIPRLGGAELGPPVFAFLAVASTAVAALLGFAPTLFVERSGITASLRRGRGITTRQRLRQVLVVSQVALAAVLLIGGGLLFRSLREVLSVEPGFNPENVLTARVQRPGPFVGTDFAEDIAFYRALTERVSGLPGVVSVAAAYQDPTSPGWNNSFRFATGPQDRETLFGSIFRPVTPGYFETNGISILRGRDFTSADDAEAVGVVIVNQAFVQRHFGDEDPLGHRLSYGDFWQARPPDYEIVGVVNDVRSAGLTSLVRPTTYFPHAQQPVREMTLTVKTAGDPLLFVNLVRQAVHDIDPSLPVDDIASMEERLAGTVAARRFLTILIAAFSTIAALLAAVGIYGVLAFMVTRRQREIGVRMAVGARPQAVVHLVLSQATRLVVIGLTIGLVSSVFATRLLERFLFQVSAVDPWTYAWVALFLGGAAVVAATIPARRAIRIDPMEVLRTE